MKINIEGNEKMWAAYQKWIAPLNENWKAHRKQAIILRSLWLDNKREIFIQAGRKFGKSETVAYILWRWALENPGANCYYIAPFMKQAKEIIWAGRRLQNFGPADFIQAENNTELRITLKNGSFIKADGSENYEAYRGITPDIVIYDEFKDFRPEFHVAMKPNLAVKNAPLIIIGTPPDHDCQYTELADEFRDDPKKAWFQFPTSDNPHISKEWLENEKASLIAKGDHDVWMREYEAKYVKGGKASIFPMLKEQMVIEHGELLARMRKDLKKLEWFCIVDPGSTTCFGGLFIALNRYTKEVYCLDEIYETTQANTSVKKIGPIITETCRELMPEYSKWIFGRDDAATWFESEMFDHAGEPFIFMGIPKNKDKEAGLSLMKDMMLAGKMLISSRCVKFYWEMENYIKDSNGKIPKKNDHNIDVFRYFLISAGYLLSDVKEPTPELQREDFRGRTIEQDFKEDLMKEDLGFSLHYGDDL